MTHQLTLWLPLKGALPLDLSLRELEVLRLFARGLCLSQVAKRLGLSPCTIRNHRASIYRKLDVGSALACLIVALRGGIVRIEDLPFGPPKRDGYEGQWRS